MTDRTDWCIRPKGWQLLACAHGSRVWFPQRCRQCLGCRRAKRNKVLARILSGLDQSDQIAFLTLTSKTGTGWPQIMRAWTRMVAFLRQQSPYLQYAAVKEQGSSTGMRHLHVILLNFAFTPQQIISRRWRQLTGAWVVNIQRIQGTRTAGYVAKYVGKDDMPLGKQVTFSRHWPKLPARPSLGWLTATDWYQFPRGWSEITTSGGLTQFLAEDCDCYAFARPPTWEDNDWLRFSEARSQQAYRAA